MRSKLLTAKQQRSLDERLPFYQKSDHTELTIWERLSWRASRITEETFADCRRYPRFKHLTDDQLWILAAFDGGDGLDLFRSAIFRRFLQDSPVEMALHLSIWARSHWVTVQFSGNDHWEEMFRNILHAACARDFCAVARLAELTSPVIAQPSSHDYASIFLGVCGLIRKDQSLLEQALKKERKSDPSYSKAIRGVLRAVADNSTSAFAEQMDKMLSGYRRYMFDDEIYGLFDPHAHGLFELARQYNPEVVRQFDIDRKLPWDREYFAWSQGIDDISTLYETDAIPERMRPSLLEFAPVPWAAYVKENWKNHDL